MARLARRLQVAIIPEKQLISPVRLLVVRDQQRCIALKSSAPLACETIANKDRPTQALPSRGVIPFAPMLLATEAVMLLLGLRHVGDGG